jgi:hypothetical protein
MRFNVSFSSKLDFSFESQLCETVTIHISIYYVYYANFVNVQWQKSFRTMTS